MDASSWGSNCSAAAGVAEALLVSDSDFCDVLPEGCCFLNTLPLLLLRLLQPLPQLPFLLSLLLMSPAARFRGPMSASDELLRAARHTQLPYKCPCRVQQPNQILLLLALLLLLLVNWHSWGAFAENVKTL
jgi:hypothetical protein